jgi:HSP20 family protein
MTKESEKGQEIEVKKTQEVQRAAPARALMPLEEMENFIDRMERLFESALPRGWLRPFRHEWPSWGELAAPLEGLMPRVDIIDRDEDLLVRAELPGVDKKDLDVTLTGNRVTIKASTRHEEKEEKTDYYRAEIARGQFSRTLSLPAEVNGAKAKATFKDGILELTIPKVASAKRQTIKVE